MFKGLMSQMAAGRDETVPASAAIDCSVCKCVWGSRGGTVRASL